MGKYIERKKQEPGVKGRAVTSSILSADIVGLIDSDGDGGHCARIPVIHLSNCLKDFN
jgi:hypothetical protein